MRSTMPFGKATSSRIQAANFGSCASARPATASRPTSPLCGTLSQDITVKGGTPAARRRLQAGEDQAEDGLRRVGLGGVGGDRRVLRVERAGRGVRRSSRPR